MSSRLFRVTSDEVGLTIMNHDALNRPELTFIVQSGAAAADNMSRRRQLLATCHTRVAPITRPPDREKRAVMCPMGVITPQRRPELRRRRAGTARTAAPARQGLPGS